MPFLGNSWGSRLLIIRTLEITVLLISTVESCLAYSDLTTLASFSLYRLSIL